MAREITCTHQIYTLGELSETAQERAHSDYLSDGDHYGWAEENIEVLKWFTERFPVRVKDWEYGYQNSITWSFEHSDYDYDSDAIAALSGWRLAKYVWNNYRADIYTGKYYSATGKQIDGRYKYKSRHSKIIIEPACPTGYYVGYDILQPIHDFLKKPTSINFYELMYDCLNACVQSCGDGYESTRTFEYFREESEANAYEFRESGKRFWGC